MTRQDITKTQSARAKEQLVKDNMGFVIAMAKKYANRGVPLEDLISEGYIGMIKAAENYDAAKGAKFTSYASNYVRQSMIDALNADDCQYNDNASQKLEAMADKESGTDSRTEQVILNDDIVAAIKLLKERERVVVSHCFGIGLPQMTLAEIAEELGVTRERVRQIRKKAIRHLRKLSPTKN